MHLAIGKWVELDAERVAPVSPGRVILRQQVAHRTEPPAVPHGGDVPAGSHLRTVLQAVCHVGGFDGERALTAVVADDHFAALEGPYLDGAALAVTRVPEVSPQLGVGTQTGGEVGTALLGTVGIEPPHPCRLALVAASHAAQQLGDVQVMQLPDEFAVPRAGVLNRIDKQLVDIHVPYHHPVAVAGLMIGVDALDAAARDEEFLQGTAVKFVKLVIAAGARQGRIPCLVFMLDVLAPEAPHDCLDQLADEVVGDILAAL